MERYLLCASCEQNAKGKKGAEFFKFLESHTHKEEEHHVLAYVDDSFIFQTHFLKDVL